MDKNKLFAHIKAAGQDKFSVDCLWFDFRVTQSAM